MCLESGPCTGGVTVKRKPETRALSFAFLFSVFKSASRLVLTDTLTPTVKHSISALTTLSRQGEHEEEHWSHRNGLKPGTKPGCFPIPWVSRAVLPTGKERGAAEHASIPARPEKARKKSCTPPDTVGCAVIDSFTVRQTTERSQRDLAASGMFFNHQGCDSPKSRTELPVVLCKGTGRREAQGARGTTPGPSCATPEVGG